MKRILIDISFVRVAGGFGTYTRGFLKELVRQASDRPIVLIENALPTRSEVYRHSIPSSQELLETIPATWRFVRTHSSNRFVWSMTSLPRFINENAIDLFHAFDCVTVPFRTTRCLRLVTLHDIIPVTHPEYCAWKDAQVGRLLIRRVVRKASCIVTDSNFSRETIERKFPSISSHLKVIYPGVDTDTFKPAVDQNILANRIAEELHLPSSKYLLCVATLNPRRNLVRLIQAFRGFISNSGDRELSLVIAGCRGWNYDALLKEIKISDIARRTHLTGFVSDLQLVSLYQSAQAVVVPSSIEGFGFPVLEAMACGTPVLCSATSSLGEIASDAAVRFDPARVDSISHSIACISSDADLRNTCIAKGLENVQHYSWASTVQKTLDLYDELLNE